MNTVEKILEKVVKKIKPPKKEEKTLKELSEEIIKVAKEISGKYNYYPMFCGSLVKGTWLPPAEIDLFLIFPPDISRKELESKGLEAGRKICRALNARYEKKYTEHPYLRCYVSWKGKYYEMDIVPCYDVPPEKIISAVDRTPWHVKYILENLKEKQKDEVRLLKKFCKVQHVYGADLLHQGFSGYLCELLILKFGSFQKLVREASKWYPQVILYLEKRPEKHVLEQFKNQPLVFIDPVDPKRNVAAAISYESFFRFVKACKEFLKKPSEKFFFKKEKELTIPELKNTLRKRDSKFYVLVFPRNNAHEDVLISQLRRLTKHLGRELRNHGFSIHRAEPFLFSRYFGILIETEVWKLPKIMKRVGPEILSKHAKEFLKHYADKKAWIENEQWVVEDERKIQTIEEFIKNFFRGSAKILEKRGVPSNVAKQSRKMKLYKGDRELTALASNSKEMREWLYRYFMENLNIYS